MMMRLQLRRIIIILCLFAVCVTASCLVLDRVDTVRPLYEQKKWDMPFGAICEGHSFVTRLPIEKSAVLDSLGISLATYGGGRTCEVDFVLYKNGEEVYRDVVENASVLIDNEAHMLRDIALPCGPEDEVYLLVSSPETDVDNAITLWLCSSESGAVSYDYDMRSGEAETINAAAALRVYEKSSWNSQLYREWPSAGHLAGVLSGVLAGAILLLVKEMLPLDKYRRRENEANHPDTVL